MSKPYQATLNAASEISNIRAWITRRKEIAKDLAFAIDMYNELTSASDYEYQAYGYHPIVLRYARQADALKAEDARLASQLNAL